MLLYIPNKPCQITRNDDAVHSAKFKRFAIHKQTSTSIRPLKSKISMPAVGDRALIVEIVMRKFETGSAQIRLIRINCYGAWPAALLIINFSLFTN